MVSSLVRLYGATGRRNWKFDSVDLTAVTDDQFLKKRYSPALPGVQHRSVGMGLCQLGMGPTSMVRRGVSYHWN